MTPHTFHREILFLYHAQKMSHLAISCRLGCGIMAVIITIQRSQLPQYKRMVAKFKKWGDMPKERIEYYPKKSDYVAQNDLSFHEILKMEMEKL